MAMKSKAAAPMEEECLGMQMTMQEDMIVQKSLAMPMEESMPVK